jgi:hypothetical protein
VACVDSTCLRELAKKDKLLGSTLCRIKMSDEMSALEHTVRKFIADMQKLGIKVQVESTPDIKWIRRGNAIIPARPLFGRAAITEYTVSISFTVPEKLIPP